MIKKKPKKITSIIVIDFHWSI